MFFINLIIIFLMVYFIFKPKKEKDNIFIPTISELKTSTENNSSAIAVKLIEPKLDLSSLQSAKEIRKNIFRPRNLREYIGQRKAKEQVRIALKIINTLKPVHFLISGRRGCGKTSLANIICKELRAKKIERIASQIKTEEDVLDLLQEINSSEEKHLVVFLDEIHLLPPKIVELFYPILEDFQIDGKNIRPFIFIGATTEKNVLLQKYAPFVDRIQINIELEKYSIEDLEQILKQYKNNLYSSFNINEQNYKIIAENCKRTPRIAIALLEKNLVEKDISKILKSENIVYQGLTKKDIEILLLLEEHKTMGSRAIAQSIGLSEKDYIYGNEHYLVEERFIVRTNRGRKLTEKGRCILLEVLERR